MLSKGSCFTGRSLSHGADDFRPRGGGACVMPHSLRTSSGQPEFQTIASIPLSPILAQSSVTKPQPAVLVIQRQGGRRKERLRGEEPSLHQKSLSISRAETQRAESRQIVGPLNFYQT